MRAARGGGQIGVLAQRPDDALAAMHAELAHTLPAETVGTTTLTSAELDRELPPMPLPEDRMSLSPVVTWGDGSTPKSAAPNLADITASRY
jgi:hypothetical protein